MSGATAQGNSSFNKSKTTTLAPPGFLTSNSPPTTYYRHTNRTYSPLLLDDSDRPVRGASGYLQMKLMLWKHMCTKLRDRKNIVSMFCVPVITFLIMWLLRKKPGI